jgi:(E)-4-hydroxy-3-methylbut-2-enyl-diphosphate synthase
MTTIYNERFFCNNLKEYSRLKTRVVHVGHIPLGGLYPIRIQSMTNTNTLDTQATVDQCIRIIEAGADYVRITAPGIKEAENLANIKKVLLQKGYRNPLVADIHFNPQAAEIAAKYVEKIRINPGNYVDKRAFQQVDFTDEEYKQELGRIRERLLPLIRICKEYKTAIRIGVNHGSLSDRIISRYGDTPVGMVESALEFLRIFAAEDFHELVVSMKASNTRIMVESVRLLVNRMFKEGMDYPLHLGVTEAGDSEDGRIKSATGTGTLLADGIGDTIRVSLTEDPEKEVPVARKLVDFFTRPVLQTKVEPEADVFFNPFDYFKRETNAVGNIGGKHQPVVIASISGKKLRPDIYFKDDVDAIRPSIIPFEKWRSLTDKTGLYPLFESQEFTHTEEVSTECNFCQLTSSEISPATIEKFKSQTNTIIVVADKGNGPTSNRNIIAQLVAEGLRNPVVVRRNYNIADADILALEAAADTGELFIDGLADGIWIENENIENTSSATDVAFGILQASRLRMSKTEYISCPSCGRTLFDLQDVTANIKARTSHLTGLKIGVMGCIVNGPGEMADADYGYVGSGPGKISLYKGREVIRRAIPQKEAVDQLIELIRENGDWKDPKPE